jgi:hypothetical protein
VLAWKDVRLVVILFAIAQLLDAVTTYIALKTNRFEEANPVFSAIVNHHPAAAVTLKVSLAAFVVLALLALRLRWRLRLAVLFLFAVASLAAPVINTLRLAGVA